MRCDNRHTAELRKEPVPGGRREQLQGGPGIPPLHTCFRKGQSGDPGGRSQKSLAFRPIQKIRFATADQCSHQKSCHTGEGRCPWQKWVPAFPTDLSPWAEGPREDKEGGIALNHPNASKH